MKAMILTAGMGTRLRPLTLERAKPAVPLLGRPLVVRLVETLSEMGVTGFRLNLHHLPDSIRSVFSTPPYDLLPVSFSYEPRILGTAGGLKANESFFDGDIFLMSNGDIVADFRLEDAIDFHRERNPIATMILYRQCAPYRHTPVRIDADFRIQGFKGRPFAGALTDETYGFTGIHIIDPRVFEFMPSGVFHEINDQVYPLLMDKGMDILGFPVEGYWNDLGDPGRYLEATKDLLQRSRYVGGSYVSTDALVRPGAQVGRGCSVEAGCVLEPGVRVEDCILWEGATVKRDVSLSRCIVGGCVTVKHDCHGKIITINGETPIADAN
jgi:NDP-sugar pyrophosphorylase family protein